MLKIYNPLVEFTTNYIKVVSDSESRLLNENNFSLSINCGSINFSKKISTEQFFKIAQIFKMDRRKFDLHFTKLLNVNLLNTPIECILRTSDNTTDFQISDKKISFCLKFEINELINGANEFFDETNFLEICKFIEQDRMSTTIS